MLRIRVLGWEGVQHLWDYITLLKIKCITILVLTSSDWFWSVLTSSDQFWLVTYKLKTCLIWLLTWPDQGSVRCSQTRLRCPDPDQGSVTFSQGSVQSGLFWVRVIWPIVSTKKIKVKHYCYNMLLITKLRVFLTFLALKWIVKV